MYIAAGQGQTTPRGQNFDVNRNLLSLRSFATSLKTISLKSNLYTFFHDFIHAHSPGAGADNPLGRNFDVNRNILSFGNLLQVSKKISLKSDFIQFVS